jgi:hypothetical protein
VPSSPFQPVQTRGLWLRCFFFWFRPQAFPNQRRKAPVSAFLAIPISAIISNLDHTAIDHRIRKICIRGQRSARNFVYLPPARVPSDRQLRIGEKRSLGMMTNWFTVVSRSRALLAVFHDRGW